MTTVFTAGDVERYYDLIELPTQYRRSDHPRDEELLHALHVHQISTVPYENLSIHYSKSHNVNIEPRAAFTKFCSGRGRGGYCMEVAVLYLHMLRAIGFDAYHTGVRIRLRKDGIPSGDYIGLVHIIIIVTLADGQKYAVDVAFGGDGPTHPMRLEADNVTTNLGSQQVRYIYHTIVQFGTDAKSWIYQYRNAPSLPWNSFYCFQEVPFLYEDFVIMNHYTSTVHPNQVGQVIIVGFLREGEEILGKMMLVNGVVKRNTGGRTEVVLEAKTEEERVNALREYFGLRLTEEERVGIRGRSTELVQ